MVYIPNTEKDRAEMLESIGVKNFEELISNIPPSLRVKGTMDLPPALSEFEVTKHLKEISKKNKSTSDNVCFLGGGAYDHIIPSLVDNVISRPEFYTAYTPYQAELSQGTLQAMYEYQSCVSLLSGMDITNSSMYDGGSAVAEAVTMAMNVSRKKKILIADTLNPAYQEVVRTYTQGIDIELIYIKEKEGTIDVEDLKSKVGDDVAAVVVQHPNFFGNLEEVDEINKIVKEYKKLQFIVSYYPISVGLLKSPADYGADIAVAEGQSLGIPLSFGGPYIGLFSSTNKNVRKMPGRMSGKTHDSKGKEGYVLTLQTREQHIKREKASSNICTNEGLMTIAVLTYLSYLGKEGIAEVAKQTFNKAHYLADKINSLENFNLKYNKEFFNEFVIETKKDISEVIKKLSENNIIGGLNLKDFGSEGLMIAVTEKRTREELDEFVDVLKTI